MVLAAGLTYIDLNFQGRPHAIATGVISGAGGTALIDPGPTSCLAALEDGLGTLGLRLADVTDVLLTHIHLDHAGATGTIVRRHPHIRVFVHERGATHMIEPQKLIDSATRLYGADMDRLWGEFLAVPDANVHRLRGGERIDAGGRSFQVAYTPGHAIHHVSYFDPSSGIAFVGDTGGVCIDGGYIIPPTPPPDIDIESWGESARRIEAWQPRTLFLTHFGPSTLPSSTHLQTLLEHLDTAARLTRETLSQPGTDDDRRSSYAERMTRELRKQMTEAQMSSYRAAAPFELLWDGLARYWRKRGSGPDRPVHR
jgi:glyoxylase-like metal-dependent hydrolase (beta-lactamase superfamily II)